MPSSRKENSRARLVNRLLRQPEKMIGAVLLGNTLVDILAASLASVLAVIMIGPAGVAYATAIMTLLIVIFAAVLPKTYALTYHDRVALIVAPIMRVVIVLLNPFTTAIQYVVRLILKFTPSKLDDAANILAAHEEIRGTIELKTIGGAVAKDDAAMWAASWICAVCSAHILVHRTKMQTIDIDEGPQKVVDEVLKSQHTRIPLWKDEPNNIVGVLHTKDLLVAWRARLDVPKLDMTWRRNPGSCPIPPASPISSTSSKRKAQLALVVDEYGESQTSHAGRHPRGDRRPDRRRARHP